MYDVIAGADPSSCAAIHTGATRLGLKVPLSPLPEEFALGAITARLAAVCPSQ
jgi:hypothetical protein